MAWEVLVVLDAATTDNSAQIIESFKEQFAPGRLRLLYERKRGHCNARITGVHEARYEYLSFVDDDNWVAEDWVHLVYRSFSTLPNAAALGGKGDAVFENGTGPVWFNQFAGTYAVGAQYEKGGDITDRPTCLLWGAGLCIRKSVFEALLKSGFEFTCTEERLGKELFALVPRPSEDTELCYGIRAIGGRLFYVPELTYKHFMTAGRLNWSWLRGKFTEHGRSGVFIQNLRVATNRTLPAMESTLERSWLFQVARALRHLLKVALRNPLSLMTESEGSYDRLQTDSLIGQLQMLVRLRGRYAVFFDENRARYAKPQLVPSDLSKK